MKYLFILDKRLITTTTDSSTCISIHVMSLLCYYASAVSTLLGQSVEDGRLEEEI